MLPALGYCLVIEPVCYEQYNSLMVHVVCMGSDLFSQV